MNDPSIIEQNFALATRADELREIWFNGNLAHVRCELTEQSSQRQAIALVALILDGLGADETHHFAVYMSNHAID